MTYIYILINKILLFINKKQILINNKLMKNIAQFLLVLLIIFGGNFIIISAQETVKPDSITSEIKAQSQTKGMTVLLKLNEAVSREVNQINLKYQLKTDSIRAIQADSLVKKGMHAFINQNKMMELKKVLTSEQYNTYVNGMANAKNELDNRLKKQ